MLITVVVQKYYIGFFNPCLYLFGWKWLFLTHENFSSWDKMDVISFYYAAW